MEPVVYRSRFFEVVEQPLLKGRSTHTYRIRNLAGQYEIGLIKWYPQWRQFCFFPSPDTVWSKGCVQGIRAAINHITNLRAKAKAGGTG